MSAMPAGFAGHVVRWQRQHGRNGLPWQGTRDPYRVWLSEIMLQQTQVSVVLEYYPRFLQRFPDVAALAAAPQDDVLGLWSGLGYYSRARNLHRCAQEVMQRHAGRFPQDAATLQTLPQALADPDPRAGNFMQRRYARADEVFARLNAALADDGVVLRLAENARLAAPLHLVFVGAPATADQAWHLRHFIELRRGAEATIVEHHFAAGEHAHLGNALAHVHLAAGARLQHHRLQHEAPRATLFARTDAVLARESLYQRIDLELGAGLSRHELNVRIEGEGAMLQADGVLLADGKRHVDTRLGIEHIARDTQCALTWRGLAGQRGKAVFHGGIVIRAGADGSEAELSNKNLLLSADAEIDTQPVLEIHADEVKAAHGATVGQLDPIALFYLRSRGLGEAEARRLLTAAFCREVVAAIDDAGVRALGEAALERALARLGA